MNLYTLQVEKNNTLERSFFYLNGDTLPERVAEMFEVIGVKGTPKEITAYLKDPKNKEVVDRLYDWRWKLNEKEWSILTYLLARQTLKGLNTIKSLLKQCPLPPSGSCGILNPKNALFAHGRLPIMHTMMLTQTHQVGRYNHEENLNYKKSLGELIQQMAKAGMDINQTDSQGNNVLEFLGARGTGYDLHYWSPFLLDLGIDVMHKNHEGLSVVDLARGRDGEKSRYTEEDDQLFLQTIGYWEQQILCKELKESTMAEGPRARARF